MHKRAQPGEAKGPDFQSGALEAGQRSAGWKQAVGNKKDQRRRDKAGDRSHRQRAHTAHMGRFRAVALNARAYPEQQAAGDHRAAAKPGEKIQPAQRPVLELNKVQAGQPGVRLAHGPDTGCFEQLPRGREDNHIFIHRHLAGRKNVANHDQARRIAPVLEFDEIRLHGFAIARRPVLGGAL